MKLKEALLKLENENSNKEEISMMLGNLKQIFSYAKEIFLIMKEKENGEEWVQEKIAICAHDLESILTYLKYNPEQEK
jgi:hypothetical protein